ncbi:MAG: pro-sigmaK processing inhibitor BofA family protein [Oscillibacter sp.]|nr:pro-sigmaK processing inhibitor BofA family protein [Oscillibacter sp.]
MDLSHWILVAALGVFFLIALIHLFRRPLGFLLRLLGNTVLGFGALALVRSTSALTGIALGLNLFNALLIGVLGVPGLILLLLSQWVLA